MTSIAVHDELRSCAMWCRRRWCAAGVGVLPTPEMVPSSLLFDACDGCRGPAGFLYELQASVLVKDYN